MKILTGMTVKPNASSRKAIPHTTDKSTQDDIRVGLIPLNALRNSEACTFRRIIRTAPTTAMFQHTYTATGKPLGQCIRFHHTIDH